MDTSGFSLTRLWDIATEHAGATRVMATLLGEVTLVSIENELATVRVSEAMFGAVQSRRSEIASLLARAWNREVRVALEVASTPGAPLEGATGHPGALVPMPEHPLVKQAIAELGARLLSVQARPRATEG